MNEVTFIAGAAHPKVAFMPRGYLDDPNIEVLQDITEPWKVCVRKGIAKRS